MIEEIWKPLEGYENSFEVSSFGNFRSKDHMVLQKSGTSFRISTYLGKDLHPSKTKDGRLKITLRLNGKKTTLSVSRIVAKHFLEDFDISKRVTFIDGDSTNCRIDNLKCI